MSTSIEKYANTQVTYFTKGLQFYKNNKFKLLIGFSWSKNGSAWEDTKGNKYKFGYFKQVGKKTTVKNFAIGRLKLNHVVPTGGK